MEQQQRPSMSIERIGSKVIVSIRGSLDSEATPLFAHFIEDLIDGQGSLNVVIDLRDVPSVDPQTVDALAHAAHREDRDLHLLVTGIALSRRQTARVRATASPQSRTRRRQRCPSGP